jgi:putative lipoprotein
MQALFAVTAYEVRGEELRLSFGDGGVLTFVREPPAVAAAPEVGRTFVFDCDGDLSFTVRTGPGEVALWTPQSLGGRYLVLGMTRTASGARYEEGDTVYWDKGDLATFEVAGQRFIDCRSNPRKVPWADAARRGVTFRALGNEPAWSLEIASERLTMITELGARRTEFPYSEPSVAGQRSTYRVRTEAQELVAVVERGACTDSMSGEAFEATATVTFDSAMYYGCGRFLSP